MGIEHAFGQALQTFAQGQTVIMPKGIGTSANQRAQSTALTLAIALQTNTGLADAIAKAMALFQAQLDNGHMALKLDGGLNEYMIPDTHAFIWYAAMGTLHELAWHRLPQNVDGVKELRKMTFQWWQHHLSLCSLMSVPADAGPATDNMQLNVGSIVSPGARASDGQMSFHRDAIYRKVMGIPQVGQAAKNPTWWTPKAPDLVGPFWVSKNLDTLPQPGDIGPKNVPMLSNPLTIRRCKLGFSAFFAKGIIPAGAFAPSVSCWMDFANWKTGFTVLAPKGPNDPEPGPPWPGELVVEYKIKGKVADPDSEPEPAPGPGPVSATEPASSGQSASSAGPASTGGTASTGGPVSTAGPVSAPESPSVPDAAPPPDDSDVPIFIA